MHIHTGQGSQGIPTMTTRDLGDYCGPVGTIRDCYGLVGTIRDYWGLFGAVKEYWGLGATGAH